MTELDYAIRNGGLTPKRLLTKITRRGFGASVVSGIASSQVTNTASAEPAGTDFTIAIIPDPQYLAESCPDNSGRYYAAMMKWIVEHKNMVLTSSTPFKANIKAVVGVGDCVNSTTGVNQYRNAEAAWKILDDNHLAFVTPPGNHDYSSGPSSRSGLGSQFATGFFSAGSRSSVYGSGISLGGGDMAYWVASYDATGANTAVKFDISGTKLLIIAMDFFAGNAAWSWAYDVMRTNPECECYITTHAWLTTNGTQFQRADGYGPNAYSMAGAPYSNSAGEAWNTLRVNTWSNLFGIFCGHDLIDSGNLGASRPPWFWQRVPVRSSSRRRQTVQQLFANSQQIDAVCDPLISQATGSGQIAGVFLLSRRPGRRLLEGRMISTHSGNWFALRSASFPGGTSWSTSETLLFSVRFTGLLRHSAAGS